MINPSLASYLNSNYVDYYIIPHSETHTAQQAAHASHISGHEFAKTVIIEVDGEKMMAVLPAACLIDFEALKAELHCDDCHLVREIEFKRDFIGRVETGAMSPFGNLHNMKVIVAKSLVHDGEIAFNAGNHHEVVVMDFWDYDLLVKPKIYDFARPLGRRND